MKVRISWPSQQFELQPLLAKAMAMKAGVHPDGIDTIRIGEVVFISFVRNYGSLEHAQPHIDAMQGVIRGLLGGEGEVLIQEAPESDFVKIA